MHPVSSSPAISLHEEFLVTLVSLHYHGTDKQYLVIKTVRATTQEELTTEQANQQCNERKMPSKVL